MPPSELTMTQIDFEVIVVTSQKESMNILKVIRDSKIDFELVKERQFAPPSPDVAIQIITSLAGLLPIAADLFKKIHSNKGYVDFPTRHKLAREMLSEFAPLQEIEADDKIDYSYYIYKTAKGAQFWEYDRGEIKHGVFKGRKV